MTYNHRGKNHQEVAKMAVFEIGLVCPEGGRTIAVLFIIVCLHGFYRYNFNFNFSNFFGIIWVHRNLSNSTLLNN
jgi:hypothetical protein